MQRLFFLLLLCSFTVGISAQELFTVRVGIFRDVKADDFTAIKSLGFVYGTPGADNTIEVFVGHYNDQNKATSVATDLVRQGFRNAQAFTLPANTGQDVTVIQLGLHSGNRVIDWAGMERAGQLYVESSNGLSKIVTGVYPDGPTALKFLSTIRQLGFQDAFVKRINTVRLIPVSTFETGIKKPLIPINLQDAPPSSPPKQQTSPAASTNTTPTDAPTTYGSSTAVSRSPAPASAPPATQGSAILSNALPAPANMAGLPAIDGKTKRHSAAELQRLLKEKGYYEASIDGFYGPGTSTAYLRAWDDMPEIRKYRLLSSLNNASMTETGNWPEIRVLMTVAEDIAGGTANTDRDQQLARQRAELFNIRTSLTPAAATRARAWAATLWANLEDWATEDPMHAHIFSAFRMGYHQSQVRLEDRYMDAGMNATDARDAATAMLQNLIGGQLDRFL